MRILDNLIYRAEELGEIKIQYRLGLIFHTGDRVERDPVQARHWFERAAANGHEEAARALAKLDGKPLKPRAPKKKPRTEIASTQSSVEDLPPVISTKPAKSTKPTRQTQLTESKSTTTEECPHGHGPLKEWKGNLRCWTCGWSKNESNPKATKATGAEEKPSLTAWLTNKAPTQTLAEDRETAETKADKTKGKENKGADLFWIIGIVSFLVAKSCG